MWVGKIFGGNSTSPRVSREQASDISKSGSPSVVQKADNDAHKMKDSNAQHVASKSVGGGFSISGLWKTDPPVVNTTASGHKHHTSLSDVLLDNVSPRAGGFMAKWTSSMPSVTPATNKQDIKSSRDHNGNGSTVDANNGTNENGNGNNKNENGDYGNNGNDNDDGDDNDDDDDDDNKTELERKYEESIRKYSNLSNSTLTQAYKNDSLILWCICKHYEPLRDELHKHEGMYQLQVQTCNHFYANYDLIREQSLDKLKAIELTRLNAFYDSYHFLAKTMNEHLFNISLRNSFTHFKSNVDLLQPSLPTFQSYVQIKIRDIVTASIVPIPKELYHNHKWRGPTHLIQDIMFHQARRFDELHVPFVLEFLLHYIENDPLVLDGNDRYLLLQPNLNLLNDDDIQEYHSILKQIFDYSSPSSNSLHTKSLPEIRNYKHAVGLLKFWLKNLVEPLVPFHFYSKCLEFQTQMAHHVREQSIAHSIPFDSYRNNRNMFQHFPLHNELVNSDNDEEDKNENADNEKANKKKRNPKLDEYIDQWNTMLAENMSEFNLKALIRLISFIKQCVHTNNIRVSDIASEWVPLLFRNPQVSSSVIERVKLSQTQLTVTSQTKNIQTVNITQFQDEKEKEKDNTNENEKENKEEEKKDDATIKSTDAASPVSGTDANEENNPSERMLYDLMIFWLTNNIEIFDDTHIKGAHTLSTLLQPRP
ncbi:MIF4G domain containing protein [Reticulomyxa filosa]|uniref:MIF4G domain containing protein n=1 Tax=Reticulomyxa filosa TaxID=46433 RepID=X6PB44_RETFI|nr:MIF4G domain containing protein [Reticulomyxa filosa]|eukprot:ETO35294.1 MIF4G domain containing protein [Reticulomyxa filosa]